MNKLLKNVDIDRNRGRILLQTIHGSRLYGLHHTDSDEDHYVVTEHGRAKQIVSRDEDGNALFDYTIIGLEDFLKKCHKGTHQALEALNSPVKEVADSHKAYFEGLRFYSPEIEDAYRRTIGYLLAGDTFKKRRHAMRLHYNLVEMRTLGRFNPRLTDLQISTVNDMAEMLSSGFMQYALNKSLDEQMWKTYTDEDERK